MSNAKIIWASLIKLASENAAFNGHVYVKLPRKVVIALRIPPDKKAKRSQIIRRSVTSFWYGARAREKDTHLGVILFMEMRVWLRERGDTSQL